MGKDDSKSRIGAMLKLILLIAALVLMVKAFEKQPEREYYKSGKIKSEIFYNYETIYGPPYYDGLSQRSNNAYVPSEPNGKARWYYESGQLKSEGFFKNGKLEGWKKDYYENGQLDSEMFFKDGEPDVIASGVYK